MTTRTPPPSASGPSDTGAPSLEPALLSSVASPSPALTKLSELMTSIEGGSTGTLYATAHQIAAAHMTHEVQSIKPQVQVLSRDWLPMTHPPSFASKDLIGCMSLVVMSRSSKKRPAGRDHAGRVDQPTPRWAPDPRGHSPCCFFRRCRVSVPLSCSTCRMICIQTLYATLP